MLYILTSLLISACKKEDDPTPAPGANVICDGNGTISYMPLALENYWNLTAPGYSITYLVVDTQTFISNKYYEVESNLGGNRYYRMKPNGDIMLYDSFNNVEVLFIPNLPTAGQTWSYDIELCDTRKVAAVNVPYTTSKCYYGRCLKIELYDNGSLVRTEYYRRGVGLVSTDIIWGGIAITKLSDVTLN